MRYSKRYIVFTIVIFVLILVKFNNSDIAGEVEQFRGARLERADWNPLIAASVNDNVISLNIGGRSYTSENTPMYMDERLQLMVPSSILRDGLNCSAHIYDERALVVQKRDLTISFSLGEEYCLLGGEEVDLISPMTRIGDDYFVGMQDLADLLEYEYDWDISQNKGVGVDTLADVSFLPYYYDLRKQARTSKIEDQGKYGTCWAFATLTALESSLLPEQPMEFAADHITLCNGYGRGLDDGGEYGMSMAYLASWQGPVLEKDDPYGDGITNCNLKEVKHVQEMQVMESGDLQKIKEAVFKYGGVQTSIYTTLVNSESTSEYYNKSRHAYCYQGSEKPNHDVVIIGWDDSFSKENFTTPPEEDGAFICQNSWGTEFGEGGVFYISYYDSNIGIHNVVYTRIDDVDNYDKIYQSDLCGWVGQVGYERESIYGANVFTAEAPEVLQAAGFYATGKDTSYDMYVVKNFVDMESLDAENRIKVASGKLTNAGYYTIDFDREISLETGERFAIIIFIRTPGAVHPMAVECVGGALTEEIDLDDGEGYISIRGSQWQRVEEQAQSNLCIKGYTSLRGDTTE